MKKTIQIKKRGKQSFFNHHLSKSMIARKKESSRNFVVK